MLSTKDQKENPKRKEKKKKKGPLRHAALNPPSPCPKFVTHRRRHLPLLNQQLSRRSDLPRTLDDHPRRPLISHLTDRRNQAPSPSQTFWLALGSLDP